MASPAIDGHAKNNTWAHLSTTGNVTLTTTLAGMLLLIVTIENTASAISVLTVTSTSGLTWTRRTTQTSAANHVVTEEWTAPSAGAKTSEVIAVTLSAAPDSVVLVAAGVSGVFSTATPFDTNVSLPAFAQAVSAMPAVSYSTTQLDDLLIGTLGTNNSVGAGTPVGWTLVDGGVNSNAGGSRFCACFLHIKSVSAAQTTQTYQPTTNGLNNISIVDAFTSDNAGGGGGGGSSDTIRLFPAPNHVRMFPVNSIRSFPRT